MPLHGRKINFDVGREFGARHVADFFSLSHIGAGNDAQHVGFVLNDAFGEQEAGGQLFIVAGRAHGDGQGAVLALAVYLVAHADFQRLLGRQLVGSRHGRAGATHFLDGGKLVASGGQQDGGLHEITKKKSDIK